MARHSWEKTPQRFYNQYRRLTALLKCRKCGYIVSEDQTKRGTNRCPAKTVFLVALRDGADTDQREKGEEG